MPGNNNRVDRKSTVRVTLLVTLQILRYMSSFSHNANLMQCNNNTNDHKSSIDSSETIGRFNFIAYSPFSKLLSLCSFCQLSKIFFESSSCYATAVNVLTNVCVYCEVSLEPLRRSSFSFYENSGKLLAVLKDLRMRVSISQ